jgi:hypothetical protein
MISTSCSPALTLLFTCLITTGCSCRSSLLQGLLDEFTGADVAPVSLFALQEFLRDGTLLCTLVARVSDTAVKGEQP